MFLDYFNQDMELPVRGEKII